MDKQRVFRRSLIAAATAMALFGGNAVGQTMPLPETEPNNFMSEAQAVEVVVNGSVSVDGVIGTLFGQAVNDVDFFSFNALPGDVITVDIDGGIGGQRDVDTVLHLFGPSFGTPLVNDDKEDEPVDDGSSSTYDPRITSPALTIGGTYTVAVSGSPVFLDADGSYDSSQVGYVGDYTLVVTITREKPAGGGEGGGSGGDGGGSGGGDGGGVVQPASIEIKTSGELVRGSRREILVALLSSPDFEPRNVDVGTLSFALGSGDPRGFKRCSKQGWRINRDNRRDLICHFSTDVNVPAGDVDAVLKGKMKGSGTLFEGKAKVKVVDRHAGRRDRDRDRDDDRDGRRGRDRD